MPVLVFVSPGGFSGIFFLITTMFIDPGTEVKLNSRLGTDMDAAILDKVFKNLGFDVELHHNRTSSQMLTIMIDGLKFTKHFNSVYYKFSVLNLQ